MHFIKGLTGILNIEFSVISVFPNEVTFSSHCKVLCEASVMSFWGDCPFGALAQAGGNKINVVKLEQKLLYQMW